MKSTKNLCFLAGPGFMLNYHTQNFISSCRNNGHKVFLAGLDKGDEKNMNFDFNTKRRSFLITDIKKTLEFKKFIEQNEIKELIFFSPKASLIAIVVKLLLPKIKIIHWHRGIYYQNWKGIKFIMASFLDWLILKVSNKNFYCSRSQLDWLKRKKIAPQKEKFGRKYQSFKGIYQTNYQKNTRSYQFGYIGRICEDKGFNDFYLLFKAVKKRKLNYSFLIKGTLDSSSKDIVDKFNEIISDNSVTYLRWDKDIDYFFRNIEIHFFPSFREGFGNVAVEAASFGVPTIAVSGVGIDDSVSERSGVLVESRDDLILEALNMINDKKVASNKSVSNSAMSWAISNFDSKNIINELVKLHGY